MSRSIDISVNTDNSTVSVTCLTTIIYELCNFCFSSWIIIMNINDSIFITVPS